MRRTRSAERDKKTRIRLAVFEGLLKWLALIAIIAGAIIGVGAGDDWPAY